MKDLYEAFTSNERSATTPKKDDFFGMLVGSWYVDYADNATSAVRRREQHFSRVLEGMAVQDVIILPYFGYGTTPRMYNSATRTWEIVYGYTGRIMRLEARKQEDRIVLSSLEDEHRKWVFTKTAENHFHRQDIVVQQDEKWQVNYDLYVEGMEWILRTVEKKAS